MANKPLSRREFLGAAAGLGGAAFLAACAQATPQVVEKVVTKEVEKQVTVKETVIVEVTSAAPAAPAMTILTIAHAWEAAFEATQEQWDNKFMEKHPDIFIKRINSDWNQHNQTVPTWAAAGQLPDIIYVHGSRAFPWNKEGIMVSIQDYVDADKAFDVAGVWEEALKLYRYQGKLYEIPYDHGPVILAYNKDLFDKASVAYPDENWTWDDFLAAAKKLTIPDQQWGYSGYYGNTIDRSNDFLIGLTGPWGGEVMDEEETKVLLDSAESLQALQFFSDLINVHKVAATPAQTGAFPGGIWIAGVVGMFGLATWGTPQMAQFGTFNYDVAPWPKGPKGRKTGSFGSGYGPTRDSKVPDKAWLYLSEYLSVAGMEDMWGKSGRGSPARKAAYQSWLDSTIAPKHGKYYLDALDTYAVTGHPYKSVGAAEVLNVFGKYIGLIQTGDMKVEEAVKQIVADCAPILSKQ